MFNPSNEQIKRFLDEFLNKYELKEIKKNSNGTIEVTLETLWESTDDEGNSEEFPISDTFALTNDDIDFGDFPADNYDDYELYEKWLLANGFHKLLKDNPFMSETKNKNRIEWDIDLPDATYDKYARLFEQKPDYNKNGLPQYATLTQFTKRLNNDLELDAKICTGRDGDPIWSETVLFKNGSEIACSDVGDSLSAELLIENDGTLYVTQFIKQKAKVKL